MYPFRAAVLSCILLAAGLCATVPAGEAKGVRVEPTKGQRWALLIGVNDYVQLQDWSIGTLMTQ